jgi:multidrug resistance efflux pump
MTTTTEKPVAHVFQFAANVADGMSLTIGGNFYVGDSLDTMNQHIDRLRRVIDRQRAKNEVEILAAELDERRKALARAHADYETHANAPKTDAAMLARRKAAVDEMEEDLQRGEVKLMLTRERAK